jgi:hypothetical protein
MRLFPDGICQSTKRCKCFKEGKRCSVHCHDSAEHDCGFLASLALWTELAMKDNPAKMRATKRLRTNTIGKVVEFKDVQRVPFSKPRNSRDST